MGGDMAVGTGAVGAKPVAVADPGQKDVEVDDL